MKKCIVVSDSFKGTLSSMEICGIVRNTVPRWFPDCKVVAIPIADGGEGTVDCIRSAQNADAVHVTVSGAYGEPIQGVYARFGSCAVIEMAAAAGLPSVKDKKDPTATTTFGVGEMILHAVKHGCTEILLGLGGSATNDGGCGCAAALGTVFTDAQDRSFIPVGATLKDIAHIDPSATKKLLSKVKLSIMTDVENPLCGKNGAAYVFAPQKGADMQQVRMLDSGLNHLAEVIRSDLGEDVLWLPGAGAAGGMGAGCVAFIGGTLRSGVDAMLDIADFDRQLENADLVITGEGRIDSQTAHGKLISGVARRTQARRVPLIAIAGCIDDGAATLYENGVTAMFATNRASLPVSELKERAAKDYQAVLEDVLRILKISDKQ